MADDEQQQQEGLSAQVARGGMAHLVCEVLPDNTVSHGGETHYPGERFAVEGLSAVGLAQGGHVTIVGTHAADDLPKDKAEAKKMLGGKAHATDKQHLAGLFAPEGK